MTKVSRIPRPQVEARITQWVPARETVAVIIHEGEVTKGWCAHGHQLLCTQLIQPRYEFFDDVVRRPRVGGRPSELLGKVSRGAADHQGEPQGSPRTCSQPRRS